MYVRCVKTIEDLLIYQQRWDELAGDCIFRSWTWLSTWWKHYGSVPETHQLAVLLVYKESATCSCDSHTSHCGKSESVRHRTSDDLIGILPCYFECNRWQGRVLRMLGDGEVCSEHLDLLCATTDSESVAKAIVHYLNSHSEWWDALHFDGVNEETSHLSKVVACFQDAGLHISRHAGPNCWSIRLPETWEEFLTIQSKSHRKQLRRLESRILQSDRICWHTVRSQDDFQPAWEILTDLHQRRRQSLGEPGCFASTRWANFHREVAQHLLKSGHLRLSILRLDGEPIAAEYHFGGKDALYVYQGGIDPTRCEEEPGRLSMIRCVQQAIEEGQSEFDLLRGDEPYKPHWRAVPHPTVNIQIVSPRFKARWRHCSASGMHNLSKLVNHFANFLG